MLAEFLDKLTDLTQPVATITVPRVNGIDTYVYSPADRLYRTESFVPNDTPITVSEVESLFDLVKGESRETGAVVIFDGSGATFLPGRKAETGRDSLPSEIGRVSTQHKYVRRHSPQWRALSEVLGKRTTLTHLQFLRTLQSLRPSIVGYAALYSAYQRISLEAGTKAASAPLVLHDGAGSSINFTVEVKSGRTEVRLPSEISVEVPLTRFGKKQSFTVEIDAEVKEGGSILFGLIAPDMAIAEEQAIAEEVQSFREAIAAVKNGQPITVLMNL